MSELDKYDVHMVFDNVNQPTGKAIAERLKLRSEFAQIQNSGSLVSRMGGGESYHIWITLAAAAGAAGGYVGKKTVDLLFEIFKNVLIREKDEPRIAITLYGPDNKLLARWESKDKEAIAESKIVTRSVIRRRRWYHRIWQSFRRSFGNPS